MAQILTTGPVENASATPAVSTWVKVLNNRETEAVQAEVTVFALNGSKTQLASAVLEVAPLSSDYEIFDITDVLQYEVQIVLDQPEQVYVSVWGKDANAELIPAHRFVTAELSQTVTSQTVIKKKASQQRVRRPRRR